MNNNFLSNIMCTHLPFQKSNENKRSCKRTRLIQKAIFISNCSVMCLFSQIVCLWYVGTLLEGRRISKPLYNHLWLCQSYFKNVFTRFVTHKIKSKQYLGYFSFISCSMPYLFLVYFSFYSCAFFLYLICKKFQPS